MARRKNILLWIRICHDHVTHFFLSRAHTATPIPKHYPCSFFPSSNWRAIILFHPLKERLCRWWMWSSHRPDAFLKCVTLPLWEHENGASSIVGSPYPARNHGSRCLPSRPSLPPVDRRLWAASAVKRGYACLSPRSDRTCPTPQKEPLNRSLV